MELERALDVGDDGVEGADGEIGLLFVNQKRRGEANSVDAGAENEEALVERGLDDAVAEVVGALFGFLVADDFDADHQAAAANIADDFVFLGPARGLAQDEIAYAGSVRDVSAFEEIHGGERGGDADGIATKSGSVRAGRPVHDFGFGDDGTERHAGSDSFGDAENVWLDAGVVHGPPFAGTAHAGLHFVGDKQDAVLAAELLEAHEEFGRAP